MARASIKETEHTPTPWAVWTAPDGKPYGKAVFKSEDGSRVTTWPFVCDCGGAPNEANSAFIVHAVNSHDDLIETLQWVRANHSAWTTEIINARIDAALSRAGC